MIDLHSAAGSFGLPSFKFFWWAPQNDFFRKNAFRPFKFIQSH